MTEKLSGWFDYFDSEQSFAVAKKTFYHKDLLMEESKNIHPYIHTEPISKLFEQKIPIFQFFEISNFLILIELGAPIIEFIPKYVKVKNKERIYENEIVSLQIPT